MPNILMIEDRPENVTAVSRHIEGTEFLLSASFRTGEDALSCIRNGLHADLYLVDIGLPGMLGSEIVAPIKDAHPSAEIVMHTVFEDVGTILRCIRAGATGYILKGVSKVEFLAGLATVMGGGSHLSGRIAKKVLEGMRADVVQVPEVTKDAGDGCDELSQRETEILKCLVQGKTYKEIAMILNISVHTVNNHLRHIYGKLRVCSRMEAVAKTLGYPRS